MACKDSSRRPAASLWLLVGFRAAFIYFDSGTSRLKLQVSQPRCRAMIDYNALTFSGLSSKSIPDIHHPFRIRHVWLGRHLGPLYLPHTLTLSSHSRAQPPLLDLQEQCHSSCIRTDPNSVPFLDIAKYSPLLTDLMATTPTLTDRISIRPGKKGGNKNVC